MDILLVLNSLSCPLQIFFSCCMVCGVVDFLNKSKGFRIKYLTLEEQILYLTVTFGRKSTQSNKQITRNKSKNTLGNQIQIYFQENL